MQDMQDGLALGQRVRELEVNEQISKLNYRHKLKNIMDQNDQV
jgi:hypothetical protein